MPGVLTGRRLPAAMAALLIGCGHGDPFRVPDYGTQDPQQPGPVVRLTFNDGHDRAPTWLPRDGGILYAYERRDRPDRDGCLGELPGTGGQRRWSACEGPTARTDSNESLSWPVVSAGGQLAYLYERGSVLALTFSPDVRRFVVTRLSDVSARRVTLTLPDSTDDGVLHASVSHPRWLDEDRLLYRADVYFITRPPFCTACPRDTLVSGRAIVLSTMGPGGVTRVTVPGTDYASSLDVAGTDTLFYTLGGDSRVLRRILSTGVVDVIWDFAPEIARGVQVRDRRLVAVAGGTVRFGFEPGLPEPVQRDSGGVLQVVQLDSGVVRVIDIGLPIRHPALAASGRSVIVEAAVGRSTDLWSVVLDP